MINKHLDRFNLVRRLNKSFWPELPLDPARIIIMRKWFSWKGKLRSYFCLILVSITFLFCMLLNRSAKMLPSVLSFLTDPLMSFGMLKSISGASYLYLLICFGSEAFFSIDFSFMSLFLAISTFSADISSSKSFNLGNNFGVINLLKGRRKII